MTMVENEMIKPRLRLQLNYQSKTNLKHILHQIGKETFTVCDVMLWLRIFNRFLKGEGTLLYFLRRTHQVLHNFNWPCYVGNFFTCILGLKSNRFVGARLRVVRGSHDRCR